MCVHTIHTCRGSERNSKPCILLCCVGTGRPQVLPQIKAKVMVSTGRPEGSTADELSWEGTNSGVWDVNSDLSLRV